MALQASERTVELEFFLALRWNGNIGYNIEYRFGKKRVESVKHKNQDTYPPLALLQRMTAKYPKAWDRMEMIHQDNGARSLGSWDSWCYAPIAAATAVVMMADNSNGFFEKLKSISYAQVIAALAPWRLDKKDKTQTQQ